MRRRNRRRILRKYSDEYFKPQGIPMRELDEVGLSHVELEVLRLRYIKNLTQHEAAEKMGISQSQYQRDIWTALKKITEALIERKALRIEKN